MAGDALDRILADDYLGELTARSLEDLRSMRGECQDVEARLSLSRRVAQGRLDIVVTERERRSGGGDPGDLSELIDKLPEILADRSRGSGNVAAGRLPADEPDDPAGDTADVPGATGLSSLPDLDNAAVDALIDELQAFERRVSDERRQVHDRIAALDMELTRRLRDGEASVETLRN